ncbi:MAG: SpoIIE family protein phosphatase [Oscillospiraceae bacterium]|nr:SpoIIE family protein phosphatase [Oscillospiraceae bacterium]
MKGSIYKKIRKQMLFGSFVAAAVVCLAAVIIISILRGSIIGASEELGTSAAVDSKTALEIQMEESLFQLAGIKSYLIDEKLSAAANLVSITAHNAQYIVSEPEAYLPRTVLFPNAANAGRSVAQLRLAQNADYADLEAEIGLLGNMSALLVSGERSLDYVRSLYIGTESGICISADVDSDQDSVIFDPRARSWYIDAKAAGEMIWTDVFADNFGRGLGITCAMPFYGEDGSLRGVAGAGMQLGILAEIVVEAKLGETGYAFIANEYGEIIISDTVTVDGDGNIISQNLSGVFPDETAARMMNGAAGIERAPVEGRECFIAYAPLKTLPWSLVVIMSVDEVVAPAIESEERIIAMTGGTVTGIDRMIFIALLVFAAALILAQAGNSVLARRLSSGLARPVIQLSEGAGIIGAGDLEYRFDVKTGDELETLSDAFNAMISNIKTITAEKERIGAELNVATQIQASMLPCIFPPFPGRKEFDIYASMLPAKEVGGDFYDFFLINESKLAVVMADVSGKGVPAALFMVIAKTLIKNNAQSGKSPKEVFQTVNDMLCENNDACMFVTAFMGYIDLRSGKLTYVNAGHDPALLKKADGEFKPLPSKPSLILAGFENVRYKEEEMILSPGDTLYLYTDGVTEAMNNDCELFSTRRLLDALNRSKVSTAKELLVHIKNEIDLFADGAEQADDITMLALKITERMESIK